MANKVNVKKLDKNITIVSIIEDENTVLHIKIMIIISGIIIVISIGIIYIVAKKLSKTIVKPVEETFEKQISGLLKLNYKIISYEELVKYKNGEISLPKHTCLIDFDDGYKGNYETAFEIIKKYNIPVSIYVVDSCVGQPGYMDWQEIKELEKSGLVTINTHGKYHDDFEELETSQAVEDIKYAHNQIEKNLEKQVIKVFTYPCGL